MSEKIKKTVVAGQTFYGDVGKKIDGMIAKENEPYITPTQYSLSDIERMLNEEKVTKENAEDILDRLYEIGAESDAQNEKTFVLKKVIRRIKRGEE